MKRSLLILLLLFILASVGLFLIFNNVDPYNTKITVFVLFFIAVFLFFWSFISIFLTWFSYRFRKADPDLVLLKKSNKRAFIFASMVVLLLLVRVLV